MRVLFLHCDSIKFKPVKKALKDAEDAALKEQEVHECLVCFTAVEKSDESDEKGIVKKYVENIKDVAGQVKAKTLVLYPYAHLSSQLASPAIAQQVLKDARKVLEKDFSVSSAPFGWYKEFTVHVKGHPLSELSREINLRTGPGAQSGGRGAQSKEMGARGTEHRAQGTEQKAEDSKPQYEGLTEQARMQKLARIGKQASLEKEKLSENDHRILGPKLGLFSFQEIAPGMVFWNHNGMLVRNTLMEFLRKERTKRNYKEINTPILLHNNVWEISGHMQNFSHAMFFTKIDNAGFGLKPMNCPGAIITYKTGMHSYKDLPLRLAEFGMVSRNELSGVLAGLFRTRIFTQDDVHIFLTREQIEQEVTQVMELIDHFYSKVFGFDYHVELSTRPEKFMGDVKDWNKAEATLEQILKKRKMKYKVNKGDGAFYGPKIDFHIKDSLGRTWQLATVQLDFQMPEKFDLHYVDEKGQHQRPVIIHNVVYGSLERFMGILIEHYQGRFPLWLSPIQARIVSFTDRNEKYARQVEQELMKAGLRVDSDFASETVDYKVRKAQQDKVPYTIVIGDKEEKAKTLAVRGRDGKVRFGVKLSDFVAQVREEIEKKK